jgi:Cas7 group CRISPR-associated protein Csh2
MSNVLSNKIDFMLIISATNANPNGDPLNGNRPRENYDGYGEISDVCKKEKFVTDCKIWEKRFLFSQMKDVMMVLNLFRKSERVIKD